MVPKANLLHLERKKKGESALVDQSSFDVEIGQCYEQQCWMSMV